MPAPTAAEFRVWATEKLRNSDTDQFGHVNHAAMMSLLEVGRIELFGGADSASLFQTRDMVVVSIHFTFHRELHWPGTCSIGSSVTRVGSSSVTVRQALFAGDTCHVSGEAICVLIDRQSRRPAPFDSNERDFLLRHAP